MPDDIINPIDDTISDKKYFRSKQIEKIRERLLAMVMFHPGQTTALMAMHDFLYYYFLIFSFICDG